MKQHSLNEPQIIAVPGFICKSITESLTASNIKFVYYDITPDLEIDTKSLALCLETQRVTAVLMIHYFGFLRENKEAKKLINKKGLFIIDDFCHSFGSFYLNNERFSNSFSSIRKYFPVKVSGIINRRPVNEIKINNRVSDLLYIFTRFLEFICAVILRINIYNATIDQSKNTYRKLLNQNISSNVRDHGLPTVMGSALTYSFTEDETLIRNSIIKIKSNYEIYVKYLNVSPLNIVFKKCTSYDVPQWFPIKAVHAAEVVKYLRKNGIGAIQWPGDELPAEILKDNGAFKVSKRMSMQIALLPVHYSLNERDILHIVSKVNDFLSITQTTHGDVQDVRAP